MTQQQDSTISRIRIARHRISEKFGHDPRRIVAYYIRLQKERKRGHVEASKKKPEERNRGRSPTTA
jgi:hypothetical protein